MTKPKASSDIVAASILIAAARLDGRYTEIERDSITQALMKLCRKTRPEATSIRQAAEDQGNADASVAAMGRQFAGEPLERREALITQIWAMAAAAAEVAGEDMDEQPLLEFITALATGLGIESQRARRLARP